MFKHTGEKVLSVAVFKPRKVFQKVNYLQLSPDKNQADNKFLELMQKETGIVLNDSQREAVTHQDGPLLLLATPGAGKTTVLNLHIAYLLLVQQVKPENILSLTFSKAAAKDMELRFNKLFAGIINRPVNFSTIHSFAFKVVRDYFRVKGYKYELIETEQGANSKTAVLKSIYQQYNKVILSEEKLEELANAIGYIKNSMVPPPAIDTLEFNLDNLKDIYLAYEEYKNKTKAPIRLLDFDDMLTMANDILEREPGILSVYQKQYQYVLTDESQDTSLIQHKIIEKIARPEANIFIVGDEDQAIYGFRGAAPQYLLEIKKIYPGAKILAMTENFRSSEELVKVTNQFIKANKKRYAKEMFTNNSGNKPIQIYNFKTDMEQLDFVVDQLTRSGDLSSTAVIYRNNASAIALINKLDQQQLPFYLRDFKNRFFNHWVVNDILNYLRLSYNDKNIAILERIYTKLNPYISKNDLELLKTAALTNSAFVELANFYQDSDKKSKEFLELQKHFRKLNQLNPRRGIQFIRTDLEYDASAERICDKLGFSCDNIKGILAILENIAAALKSHEEFAFRLKHLERLMDQSKFNQNRGAVTLTTMHSAKGLEFKQVYLIDLIDGVIPGADSIKSMKKDRGDSLEEERRLFYVGMTRTIEELFLLTTEVQHSEKVKESRFLKEVRQIIKPNSQNKGEQRDKPLAAGEFVEHKKFGVGKIISVNKDILRIEFESGQVKELLLKFCLESNLLRVL